MRGEEERRGEGEFVLCHRQKKEKSAPIVWRQEFCSARDVVRRVHKVAILTNALCFHLARNCSKRKTNRYLKCNLQCTSINL